MFLFHVLALREKQLGLEHPDTLWTMHNLADVYDSQGRHSEAETQYKLVLALREKQLGLEHPHTQDHALSRHCLQIPGSIQRGRDAVQACPGPHGETAGSGSMEHPDTLLIMDNCANVYESQGRHSEAVALREQVEVIKERKRAKERSDPYHSIHS
jgi:tetratricopeptide (TPR) repeat protein